VKQVYVCKSCLEPVELAGRSWCPRCSGTEFALTAGVAVVPAPIESRELDDENDWTASVDRLDPYEDHFDGTRARLRAVLDQDGDDEKCPHCGSFAWAYRGDVQHCTDCGR
jgi:DNA-directed RNA polymerase subunit RPC12/RpoP